MKYCSKITGWGPDALFFLEDPDAQFMIIFNEDAPPELAEISVLHTKSGIYTEPENGDTVLLGDKVFEVTAVGEEARHTWRDLGHCTLCFKGGDTPDRPGCIMLAGDEPLQKKDIQTGMKLEIH